MTTYKIIRFFKNHDKRVIRIGLSLKEAQKHCGNKETSCFTCVKPANKKYSEKMGIWLDGYEKE